jgi:hypothetical protein
MSAEWWQVALAGAGVALMVIGGVVSLAGEAYVLRKVNGKYVRTEILTAHLGYIRESLNRIENRLEHEGK